MKIFWIALGIIVVDQATKWAVHQFMYREQISLIGESLQPYLGDWLKFTYTQNPGMAFGIEFGPEWLIPLLSIVATVLILIYLLRVGSTFKPYQLSITFILGGAIGNIIDRVFYGLIYFDKPLFAGEVIDFIHFDLWQGMIPASWPLIGGTYMALFPIWNVADMAIVLGVVGMLYYQGKFQEHLTAQEEAHKAAEEASEPAAGPDPVALAVDETSPSADSPPNLPAQE